MGIRERKKGQIERKERRNTEHDVNTGKKERGLTISLFFILFTPQF